MNYHSTKNHKKMKRVLFYIHKLYNVYVKYGAIKYNDYLSPIILYYTYSIFIFIPFKKWLIE